MLRRAAVALGGLLTVASAAALIYVAVTPAALVGHPDPHGDGASGLIQKALGSASPAPIPATQQASGRGRSGLAEGVDRVGTWIEIPADGIALPLVWGSGSGPIPDWKALVYPGTAWPGRGDSLIYAHAQWGMFGGLFYARTNDTAYIHDYSSGRVMTFHVSRVVGKVAYNDGSWIYYHGSRPTLTLLTCTDWSPTSPRYVVQLV